MSLYTVKQVAELSGVSVRTLHHYDEIGLLKPRLRGCERVTAVRNFCACSRSVKVA